MNSNLNASLILIVSQIVLRVTVNHVDRSYDDVFDQVLDCLVVFLLICVQEHTVYIVLSGPRLIFYHQIDSFVLANPGIRQSC